jgi:hypothetical protein
MHASFPDWYRLAGLKPESETIQNRSKVVDAYALKLDVVKILKLVGFFIGKTEMEGEPRDELNRVFQEADPAFSVKDNTLELRVLAGSLLATVMENAKGSKPLVAALSINCGNFGIPVQKALIPDVGLLATEVLQTLSSTVRQIGTIGGSKLESLKIDNFADPNVWGPQIKEFTKTSSTAINRIEEVLRILAEETNILWWLLADYSNDLDQPFEKVSAECLCLVPAKELADLTGLLPGPLSAKATLSKIINRRKNSPPVKLMDAVNAIPRNWRESRAGSIDMSNLGLLIPITLAVVKSLETDDKASWVPVYNKASGISAKQTYTELELAFQFYQECLLIRAATGVK